MKKDKRYIFLIVLLLGLFLRIYDLGTKDIWYDESMSLLQSMLPLKKILAISFSTATNPFRDTHPFLYHLLLHFWLYLGKSEFLVRLPSVIAGIISIYIVYLIAKIFFDEEVSILAMIFAAFSPFFIYYSQEARMYIFNLLFTLFSFYFLGKLINEVDAHHLKSKLIGFTIFTLLNLYTHYFAIFYLIAQNFFIFILYRKFKHLIKSWLFIQVIIALLSIPLIYIIFNKFAQAQNQQWLIWIPPPSVYHLLRIFRNWNFTFLQLHGNPFYPVINKVWATILIAFLLITGFARELKVKLENKELFLNFKFDLKEDILFLILWLFIPLILVILLSLKTSFFVDRYLIGVIPPVIILIAKGIKNLYNSRLKAVVSTLVIIIYIASCGEYYGRYNIPHYPDVYLHSPKGLKDIKEMSNLLKTISQKDDIILADNSSVFFPLLYYTPQLNEKLYLYENKTIIHYRAVNLYVYNDLNKILLDRERILLVHSSWSWITGEIDKDLKKWLDKNTIKTGEVKLTGIDLLLLKKK